MNGLDLFSGIGGITLALSEWVKPIAYCENDRYAQAVLLSRMLEGQLSIAPIWDDVTTLRGEMLPPVDIIYGGFPCQDISCAGNGKGLEGQRSGLFFEIVRLAEELKPTFLFLENVPTIRTRGLDEVGKQLADLGYDCRWCTLSAEEIGAPHKRNRWWLLAHAKREQLWEQPGRSGGKSRKDKAFARADGKAQFMANTKNILRKPKDTFSEKSPISQSEPGKKTRLFGSTGRSQFNPIYWAVEPNVGRVVNGVPFRVDKLKCLGNAVVPLQAKEAFKMLMGITPQVRS